MNKMLETVAARVQAWGVERCLKALLCAIVALCVLQSARIVFAGVSARGVIKSLERLSEAPPARAPGNPLEDYDEILAKGVFGKAKKKGPPTQAKLFGILGDQALLGAGPAKAKFYEVGKEVPGGGKLLEIKAGAVVLEHEGKKRTLNVFPELKEATGKKKQQGPGAPPAPEGVSGPPAAPKPVQEGEQGGMRIRAN